MFFFSWLCLLGVADNVRKQDSITLNRAKYRSKQEQSKVTSY